ncbi:hypothetical protein ACFVSQ_17325 [Streptomyces niveus]|uniref:hypothetical protein n=1 Tax=Streptomyces niveus TaxID=193462 RepID=UPI0036E0C5AB
MTCRAQPNSVAHKAGEAAARAHRAVGHLFLLCLIGANRQPPTAHMTAYVVQL